MFASSYSGKRVFITGHTGFKGSWLAFWLTRLGAEVTGYSLAPETSPNHFDLLNLPVHSAIADIRDGEKLSKALTTAKPDIVFHLAAQPLVRRSYQEPAATFAANVMGTVNLFEACRHCDTVRAIVNITSDKCYENREWVWGYRENDPMGGHDPYSASKGCAELVTASWRNSFFNPTEYGKKHQTLLASVRAGNVIGGGDWGEDRLIPDIMRAIKTRETLVIRSPHATRPWQHVLEPLGGYLLLGSKLLQGHTAFAKGWNFGPNDSENTPVGEVVKLIKTYWNAFDYVFKPNPDQPHEAGLLKLDCSQARALLNWRPIWDSEQTLQKTVLWYKAYYQNQQVNTGIDLESYTKAAHHQLNCIELTED